MDMLTFFRNIYADNGQRKQLRRALGSDAMLYAKNSALRPLENLLARRHHTTDYPIVFIVAPPRSGTTLLFQLMARYLKIEYPTNFVARYWMAPLCGMHRQRMVESRRDIPLESQFGGTRGDVSPHEFSWFWQFWSGFFATDDLTPEELDTIAWPTIRRELGAMCGFRKRPLVLKSLNYLVYNIPRFARELPNSCFIYIQRDPVFVAQSILESRMKRYGRDDLWWTIRPRDVADWTMRSPIDQVCHQVTDITRGIEEGLAELPKERHLKLRYSDLVAAAPAQLSRIAEFAGCESSGLEQLRSDELVNGNAPRLSGVDMALIRERLQSCE